MNMKALSKWFVFVVASFVLLCSVQAATPETPDDLVKRVSVEVLELAKKDAEVKKGNMQRIFRLVEEKVMPYVDFEKTTSIAVGKYWRQATLAQREELTKQFHDLLFYTYASAISKVEAGHKLEFQKRRINPDATEAVVNSRITQPKNPEPITLSYRLEKKANGWRIYDIAVMGAWLSETYKTTFTHEIGRSGIDGLIKMLKEKNASLARGGKPAK
jgi:phospholipid transport system substrate-binding protein